MAQRRMFSPDIVASDAFLDMPTSSRELYFQLGMYADDDGFVSPRKIMRLVGASDDDLKVLLTKRFVLTFESGVIVIKHWLIHNLIRKDRYKETRYLEEKKTLRVKENGSYTELATKGLPNGNQMEPQVRLGKVRLSKYNTTTQALSGNEVNEMISLFKPINPSIERYYGNKTQRTAVERMLKTHGKDKLTEIIKVLPQVNAKKYWPKSTTPVQLENNLPIYKAKSDEEKLKGVDNNSKFSFSK